MKSFALIGLIACIASVASQCTETTSSGTHSPSGYCAGDLIFEDNFNDLDRNRWRHEITLAGGGNWEFQWYVNDNFNSYTAGGALHIRPSLTSAIFGEDFLTSGRVIIPPEQCTQGGWYGCDRQGTPDNIINPIRSGRITTWDSFRFRYGIAEIRAKLPAGDWLWPALWLMPRFSVYGDWPTSGEIDLMESRGNRAMYSGATNIGVQQSGSTLHFGPRWDINGYETSTATQNRNPGFNEDFHTYRLEWTSSGIRFLYDGQQVLDVPVGTGFWDRGGFQNSGVQNPWTNAGAMAPFDQEFFFIMNLATGGTNGYFPDGVTNPHPKPWSNQSPTAAADFWRARNDWLPTWNIDTNEDSHLQVDYVRVWAV